MGIMCNSLLITLQGQVLKGKLVFGSTPAKGIKVILVERTKSNEKITGNLFFYGDNLSQLKSMNAVVAITNNEGWYYFNKIRTGRYILKVCESYGTVYKFTVTEDKYEFKLIPELHATYNN